MSDKGWVLETVIKVIIWVANVVVCYRNFTKCIFIIFLIGNEASF